MSIMMRRNHPFWAILLGLLLAVTGHSMAVARGSTAATGQMTLCTNEGPVLVYTDVDGQPTAAPHFCPDCALSVLGVPVQNTDLAGLATAQQRHNTRPETLVFLGCHHEAYRSRAPPETV